MHNKKLKVFLRSSCAFSILVQFCKIPSCKPGYAPASPTTHFLCSAARIRPYISAASFCSCKLLGRSDERVLIPCFNAQPDIFAVMNCCIVALLVFSSDMLAWRADSLYLARGWGYPPLSLIFYENFITCAKQINCFRKVFACLFVDVMQIPRNEFACKFQVKF